MPYWYNVTTDDKDHTTDYQGHEVADAMAAWSKAVSDGKEYVTLDKP